MFTKVELMPTSNLPSVWSINALQNMYLSRVSGVMEVFVMMALQTCVSLSIVYYYASATACCRMMVELACAVALMMLISYSTLDCSYLTSYRIICACCSNSFMYRFCTETYVSTFYKLKIGNINLSSFRIHLADL